MNAGCLLLEAESVVGRKKRCELWVGEKKLGKSFVRDRVREWWIKVWRKERSCCCSIITVNTSVISYLQHRHNTGAGFWLVRPVSRDQILFSDWLRLQHAACDQVDPQLALSDPECVVSWPCARVIGHHQSEEKCNHLWCFHLSHLFHPPTTG